MVQNICGVVVVYRPPHDFVENVKSYLSYLDFLIIVCNSDFKKIEKDFRFFSDEKIKIIDNRINLGLGVGLNTGFNIARQQNYDGLVTLDQDSRFKYRFSDKALDVFWGNINRGSITPSAKDMSTERYILAPKEGAFEERMTALQSGTLLKTNALESIGGFREDFFIDGIDFDANLKMRKLGYKIIVTSESEIMHSIGKSEINKFIFWEFVNLNYSYVRLYYLTRNSMILIKENFYFDRRFCLRQVKILLSQYLGILYSKKQVFQKIRYVSKGIIHGIIGGSGKLD